VRSSPSEEADATQQPVSLCEWVTSAPPTDAGTLGKRSGAPESDPGRDEFATGRTSYRGCR